MGRPARLAFRPYPVGVEPLLIQVGIKKTQKTPDEDLALARKRMKEIEQ